VSIFLLAACPVRELCRINVCDVPEMYEVLRTAYKGNAYQSPLSAPRLFDTRHLSDTHGINVLRDGHYVSRTSDFILYSVEAEHINRVVAQYGPCELLSYVDVVRSQMVTSYQGRGHCRWSDVSQGTRASSIRATSPRRCAYRFLPFVAWPDCVTQGPATGAYAYYTPRRTFLYLP
jgi:hypothetical protein